LKNDFDYLSPDDQSGGETEKDPSSSEDEVDLIDARRQSLLYELVAFILNTNLDKTKVSSLLHLLRTVAPDSDLPRTSAALWEELGVEFSYETTFYCSNPKCFARLTHFRDVCTVCTSQYRLPNSELIIFPIQKELERLVQRNIELIEWYRQQSNQIPADVISGQFCPCSYREITFSNT
jgi:hypothetical protein